MRTVLIFLLFVSPSFAEEPRVIPLGDIWATDMPGTREVFDTEQNLGKDSGAKAQQVRDTLRDLWAADNTAGDIFVVPGEGIEALTNVQKVLAGESDLASVTTTSACSLFFYVYPTPVYVVIDRVTVSPEVISIHYSGVAQRSTHDMSPRYALIPLGNLPAGFTRIEVHESLPEDLVVPNDTGGPWIQFVCKSTVVIVPPPESTVPRGEIWAYDTPGTKDICEIDTDETNSLLPPAVELPDGVDASPAFLVRGHGREALIEAHKVLVEGEEPDSTLPANTNLSLVFFAYSYPGVDFRVDSVVVDANRIEVSYRFVSFPGAKQTHLAIVPLGHLPVGKGEIHILRKFMSRVGVSHNGGWRFVNPAAFLEKNVCGNFSYSINNER